MLGPGSPGPPWLAKWHRYSEAGSRFAERLLTEVATCRQQGRPLLHLLVAAGEAALKGTASPSLLPTRPR
jgi:transposase